MTIDDAIMPMINIVFLLLVFFLVAGGTDQFPHHAIVGPQGRFPFRGQIVVALGDDPLSTALDGLTVENLLGPGVR